jgi:hypothetical protein
VGFIILLLKRESVVPAREEWSLPKRGAVLPSRGDVRFPVAGKPAPETQLFERR